MSILPARAALHRLAKIYLAEWMQAKGFDDTKLAKQLGCARETVSRYRNYPHRLNTTRQAEIAAVLGINPGDLWRRPTQASLDAMLEPFDEATRIQATELIRLFLSRPPSR